MKNGYFKVAAATPHITVGDTAANTEQIIALIGKAKDAGVKLLALPELCVTGATCGDLFAQRTLLTSAEQCAKRIVAATKDTDMITIFGMPFRYGSKVYDCAVTAYGGEVLGVTPRNVFSPRSMYGMRSFSSPADFEIDFIDAFGQTNVPFGLGQMYGVDSMPELRIAVELGEDAAAALPLSARLAADGATVIVNLSASGETVCSQRRRRALVTGQSSRLICGYICAEAGAGESTTDGVFSGNSMIAECGKLLAENEPFSDNDMIITELDIQLIDSERSRAGDVFAAGDPGAMRYIRMTDMPLTDTVLTRKISSHPFAPDDPDELAERCERILDIQTRGLAKRLEHAYAKCAVVAVSGGLDSCLALLVTVRAMDLLGRDRKDIITISMPGFGSTGRTRTNAQILCEELGTSYREINITEAVRVHFADIGHDENEHDVTYENSQARERTQIAMDIANKLGGMLVGTGDLSELALGWATYNGDHMSMYGVNASIPKTLVRLLVGHCADSYAEHGESKLADTLRDIIDTPVSPELLPADDKGAIAQKTEDIVGPYELHDFFLYYMLRYGFEPEKLFRMACYAFDGAYDAATILKWQTTLTRRFFVQQFKRSCLPDGAATGSVGLSPRGGFVMPSDASARSWLDRLEQIKAEIE